jgi:hypothetical protein
MLAPEIAGDKEGLCRVYIDADVFVFVEETGVVHLPSDGAGFAGGGVFELENVDGFRADGLRDGHAGSALSGVGQDFDAAPFVDVELRFIDGGERGAAVVVHARAVIPVAAVGDLELNAGQGIERLFARLGAGAEDENAGLVIGLAGDVTHGEREAEAGEILRGVDDAAAGAGAGHGAVFDDPTGGGAFGEFGGIGVFEQEFVQARTGLIPGEELRGFGPEGDAGEARFFVNGGSGDDLIQFLDECRGVLNAGAEIDGWRIGSSCDFGGESGGIEDAGGVEGCRTVFDLEPAIESFAIEERDGGLCLGGFREGEAG